MGAMLDQDIWNELFQHSQGWNDKLHTLPCTWNYLPIGAAMGNIYTWNQQEFWPPAIRDAYIYPGLLSAVHMVHACGGTLERTGFSVPWYAQEFEFGVLRSLAEKEGRAGEIGEDVIGCPCGVQVKLLHAMGHFRSFGWLRELLGAWARYKVVPRR